MARVTTRAPLISMLQLKLKLMTNVYIYVYIYNGCINQNLGRLNITNFSIF